VRTAEKTAAMLVAGVLVRADWPELDDEDFATEVRSRLSAVGLELVGAGGRWLARPAASLEADEGFEPAFALNTVEMAMIAALYLHLRYLPRQAGASDNGDEPSVEVDELLRPFNGYQRGFLEKIVLGHLRNAGFVERRGGRLFAGPFLAAINDIEADERAQAAVSQFLLRRFLRRRAEELEGEHAPG
jgi:hypothetical protein